MKTTKASIFLALLLVCIRPAFSLPPSLKQIAFMTGQLTKGALTKPYAAQGCGRVFTRSYETNSSNNKVGKDLLWEFTNDCFGDTCRYLRGLSSKSPYFTPEKRIKFWRYVDKELPTHTSGTLYRSMRVSDEVLDGLIQGRSQSYEFGTLSSFSKLESVAQQMRQRGDQLSSASGNNVIFAIDPMKNGTAFREIGDRSAYPNEQEVVSAGPTEVEIYGAFPQGSYTLIFGKEVKAKVPDYDAMLQNILNNVSLPN